jgi:hypothetical protein
MDNYAFQGLKHKAVIDPLCREKSRDKANRFLTFSAESKPLANKKVRIYLDKSYKYNKLLVD